MKQCAFARWPGGIGQPLWRGPDKSLLSEMEKHAGSEQELTARLQAVLVPNTCFSAHPLPSLQHHFGCTLLLREQAQDRQRIHVLKYAQDLQRPFLLMLIQFRKTNRTVESEQSHAVREKAGGTGPLESG